MTDRLKGCMTALVTPFTEDGALDEAGLERLVSYQLESGMDVLVPLGSTGEAMVLDGAEQARVLGIVRRLADGAGRSVPVMAGAGSNDTRATLENCRRIADAGAEFALVVGPYYNKPPQEGFFRHFEAVAEGSPIPVVVYNVPGRTGSNILPETILRLAAHPGIVGVKEASGNLAQASAIIAGRPEGFAVLSGEDDLTLPMMALGADGIISVASNAAPALMQALAAACLASEWEEARRLHYLLRPLFIAEFTETNPIPIKAAVEELGLAGSAVRLPLVPATGKARTAVREALIHAGLIAGDDPTRETK